METREYVAVVGVATYPHAARADGLAVKVVYLAREGVTIDPAQARRFGTRARAWRRLAHWYSGWAEGVPEECHTWVDIVLVPMVHHPFD